MTNGLTDEAIAAYAVELLEIEAAIELYQDDKKAVYANLRETYGKPAANSLKLAIKRYRMDDDKRTEADEIDAEAERFLSIILKPSAPRATRTREIIEEFGAETQRLKIEPVPNHDPETGEITDTVSGHDAPEADEVVVTAASSSADNPTTGVPEDVHSPHASVGLVGPAFADDDQQANTKPTPIPEPASPLPEIAATGDSRAATLAAATVVGSNVTTLRTHNPATHFLNSEGLPRLHGCLKAELCGSTQPRLKLCFNCSVVHDGPTPQVEAG